MEKGGILASIVGFSLRFRGTVIAIVSLIVIYSLYTLARVKYDVFPEFAPPQVSIRVEAPGFSPGQVEKLITTPVESAIIGVQGIETLRSTSTQGLSAITAIFQAGTDIYRARQMVAENLASLAGRLPGRATPFITPLTSSTGTVLQLGLTSARLTPMQLRSLADWTIKPRLLAAAGVAQVQIFGGEVKQLQFQVDPELLTRFSLSIDDVLAAARKATGVREGGFIDTAGQRIILQTEGQSVHPDHLAGTVLFHREGSNVFLGDIASVADAPEPPYGAASINGNPAVVLLVSSQYGANTIEVTGNLDRAINELRPVLDREGVVIYPDLFRPATFIQTAVRNLLTTLAIGAALVVIILLLFLFNLRTAAISFAAIPVSLIIAAAVLDYLGYGLNTMILGGLAIAIGEVVDDAVIDVENIFRRLRENRGSGSPRPVFRVILDASIEVRGAVVFATISVVLVFIPILTMPGVAGRLFAPLGIAYIAAVLASLAVALTLTPASAFLLLGMRDSSLKDKEPPLTRILKNRYERVLVRIQNRPRTAVVIIVILVAAAAAVAPFLKEEFLPSFREGDFIVHMKAAPGTSLQESLEMGRQVAIELLKIPCVGIVSQKTGRAKEGASIRGTNESEIDAALKIFHGQLVEFSKPQIRELLARFPGADFTLNSFLTERIDETISGFKAPIVINIFGNDLDVLDRKAGEVYRILSRTRGVTDLTLQSMPGTPQISINLNRDNLARWGFDPVSVLDAVRTAYHGSTVGRIYEGEQVFDVVVILSGAQRNRVSALGGLPVRSPSGVYLPLRELAEIREESGRPTILHEGARRVQAVTCNVAGRSMASFVKDARSRIADHVQFPDNTYFEIAGTAKAQQQFRRDLLVRSLLAGAGIILLLSVVLGNYRDVLLVLLNLPFALVGGIFAAWVSGGTLSLGSMVGFVTIFGITLRNSIMMLSHFDHLVAGEGMAWGPDAALRGASERLSPILMTALVTGFGLLPLVVGGSAAGREIEGPMATVILGGLVTSTALNLLVMPTLALRYGVFGEKREN